LAASYGSKCSDKHCITKIINSRQRAYAILHRLRVLIPWQNDFLSHVNG